MPKTIETTEKQKGVLEHLQRQAQAKIAQAEMAKSQLSEYLTNLITEAGGDPSSTWVLNASDMTLSEGTNGARPNRPQRRAATRKKVKAE